MTTERVQMVEQDQEGLRKNIAESVRLIEQSDSLLARSRTVSALGMDAVAINDDAQATTAYM
jgi:hypothetical protein